MAYLCEACENLDFDSYLSRRIGSGPIGLLPPILSSKTLGHWKHIQRNTRCQFCLLVTECIRSLPSPLPLGSDLIKLSNRKSWELSSIHEDYDGWRSRHYSNKWDLQEQAQRTRSNHVYRFLIYWKGCKRPGEIQYLAHHEPLDRRQFFGRRIDPQTVSWDVINSWLEKCETYHRGTCDKPGLVSYRLPEDLRVIDLDNMCVITAPAKRLFNYVALTYVWGEEEMGRPMPRTTRSQVINNQSSKDYVVKLPNDLPRTIKDAIFVTQELGFRYLWVDSLCIIQDDPREKHSQISRMDAVYNCAALTIAAGSGRHADSGIPGVSVPRRYQQKSAVIKGLRLAVGFPKYNEVDKDDYLHWNTRGWTFQEKVLSRKLLLFTDFQVYYRCSNAIWAEDTMMEYGRLSDSFRRRLTPFRWAPERQVRKLSAWERFADMATLGSLNITDQDEELGYIPNYVSIVAHIMKRNFTYQEDMLPATEGILRTLDTSESAFHAGLPWRYIKKFLLWHPALGSSISFLQPPRTTAPSWSWAAWILSKGCRWHAIDLHNSQKLVASTQLDVICRHEEHGCATDFYSRTRSSESSRRRRDYSYLVTLPSCIIKVKNARVRYLAIDTRRCNIRSDDKVVDLPLVDKSNRCVGEIRVVAGVAKSKRFHQFWAMSEAISLLTGNPDTIYKPYRTTVTYTQKVTGEKTNSLPLGRSSAQYNRNITKQYLPRSQWPVVNVMLVDLSKGEARRIAIGKVLKTAWDTHKLWFRDSVCRTVDFFLV